MSSSKLTSKFQATIPKEIRKSLKLKAGDTLTFQILDSGAVVLQKSKPFDIAYLRLLDTTMAEWKSENDDETFAHLQDL